MLWVEAVPRIWLKGVKCVCVCVCVCGGAVCLDREAWGRGLKLCSQEL
jgi:hypothetical protein